MPSPTVFISHASADDAFVKSLRQALEFSGLRPWADSRELAPGDLLQPEIEASLHASAAFVVVVSGNTFRSKWVKKELDFALALQKERGPDAYRVVPLLLDDETVGTLTWMFPEEPVAVQVSTRPGGLQEAMNEILVALRHRLPDDAEPAVLPSEPSVNELLLSLESPAMYTEGGLHRGMARAKLEFNAADGSDAMESRSFEFISPLGPIEAERLKWYIEEFPRYPFLERILDRAAAVEAQIPHWGKALLDALTPAEDAREVLKTWLGSAGERRFSIKMEVAALRVDTRFDNFSKVVKSPSDGSDAAHLSALEASGILLSTPWEILHDGKRFLFQGQNPVRVRRRLPFREKREAMPLHDVLRILLVVPRPEDATAGLMDHRLATRALLDAVDALGELAELSILETPTFPAFCQKVREANAAGKPFSVVHFDGHGVFDRSKGRGALCFESHEAQEQAKLEGRATHIVDTYDLAAELDKLRIPLFFLDACQSAMTEQDPTTSVAATLLENGVASVAAMSHSVLVATAGRFAAAFYRRLAEGALVGSAMLAGQRALYDDRVRMDLPDGEKLRLHDWFVPVLFQEKKDPQLVPKIPARAAQDWGKRIFEKRLGDMPPEPKHGFVGRDRELLRLERQIHRHRWAALRGQGGAGKTTLATEFARWMLRTRRFGRLAFVSFEFLSDARAALDSLGKQLVHSDFSVATFKDEAEAMLHLDRALRDYPTLIVLDNLESILPDAEGNQPPSVLAAEQFVAFFQRLLESNDRTRLVLTTRERMPAPFDRGDCETHIGALAKQDALELIAQIMRTEDIEVPSLNSEDLKKQFEALASTANYHARALTLLTYVIAERRADLPKLNADLSQLMAEMDKKYPGSREKSLFASIELSLRRLPTEMQKVAEGLAVYHGGADAVTWAMVVEHREEDVAQTVLALVQVGLAELVFDKYPFYLRFDPALPAYLSAKIDPERLEVYRNRWLQGVFELSGFLYNLQFSDAGIASEMCRLSEPNLLAMLATLSKVGEPEAIIHVAGKIEALFSNLGRKQVSAFCQEIRQQTATKISAWSHAQYLNHCSEMEIISGQGDLNGALQIAQAMLQKCDAAGAGAYPEAQLDTADANHRVGRMLVNTGNPEKALPFLEKSLQQFSSLVETGSEGAARMIAVSLAELGDCLGALGQFEMSAKQYKLSIEKSRALKDLRQVAAASSNLAYVLTQQKDFSGASELYAEAKNIFEEIKEPVSVAMILHRMGLFYTELQDYPAAEKVLLEALTICVREKIKEIEADVLTLLGSLYVGMGKLEDAVQIYEKTALVYAALGDLRFEGFTRANIGTTLLKLHRPAEARVQLEYAIECLSHFGLSAEPWKVMSSLSKLEIAEDNAVAAAEARQRALMAYEQYRKQGGECQSAGYQVIAATADAIQSGGEEKLLPELEALFADDLPPSAIALLRQLCTILRGSRDTALADDPELDFMDAVELQILLVWSAAPKF